MALDTFDTVLSFAAVMLVLSMFVTACVQLASAFFRLRSGSLAWGLQQMFEQLELERTMAGQLARQVVNNVPVLKSGSRWLFSESAEAIKPAELTKILRGIAAGRFGAGGLPSSTVQDWLQKIGAKPGVAAELAEKLPLIEQELQKLFPDQIVAAREAVARAVDDSDALAARIDDWFDSAMSRAADRFTLMARYWTVAISAVLVLWMNVDAVELYRTLNKDAALRAKWVAQVEPLVANAEKLLGDTHCAKLASQVLKARADAADTTADIDKAIHEALAKSSPDSREEGRQLLRAAKLEAQIAGFDTAYDAKAKACFGEALAGVKKQAEDLKSVQPLLGAPAAQANPFGLLLAWVLLSLGAPFWFNALKNLSSLRPLIASKANQATAKPATGAGTPT